MAIVQQKKGYRATFDDAIDDLAERREKKKKKKLSDLAGSWKMSDKEAEEFLGYVKRGWRNWKIPSV